jgi:hypothetical protein
MSRKPLKSKNGRKLTSDEYCYLVSGFFREDCGFPEGASGEAEEKALWERHKSELMEYCQKDKLVGNRPFSYWKFETSLKDWTCNSDKIAWLQANNELFDWEIEDLKELDNSKQTKVTSF